MNNDHIYRSINACMHFPAFVMDTFTTSPCVFNVLNVLPLNVQGCLGGE